MTTRNRFDWQSALIWGGLALFWIAVIYWRFSTWTQANPNLNH